MQVSFARVGAVVAMMAVGWTAVACTSATPEALSPPNEPTTPQVSTEPWGQGDPIDDEPALSEPTSETVLVTDPVAQSFTVRAPAGWDTTAYSTGMFSDHRRTVASVSPDGKTMLFAGDPYAPSYWSPSHPNNQTDFVRQWVDQSEIDEWSDYLHATVWLEDWVLRKFGALDGFTLLATTDNPAEAQRLSGIAQQAGQSLDVSAARTTFVYTTADGTMSGLTSGVTYGNGQTWTTQVHGLSTLGNAADYEPMLDAMAASIQITPEWQSRQNQFWDGMRAQSEAFTRQLIANHNANMDWIRRSAAAHQNKMQSIWAANDAGMANYYNRMASMDGNQRSFLNYIQGENTVRNTSGQTFQVAQGAEVYYVNPSTNAAIGGNANFSEQDLIAMGLNPSEWTATEIIR